MILFWKYNKEIVLFFFCWRLSTAFRVFFKLFSFNLFLIFLSFLIYIAQAAYIVFSPDRIVGYNLYPWLGIKVIQMFLSQIQRLDVVLLIPDNSYLQWVCQCQSRLSLDSEILAVLNGSCFYRIQSLCWLTCSSCFFITSIIHHFTSIPSGCFSHVQEDSCGICLSRVSHM